MSQKILSLSQKYDILKTELLKTNATLTKITAENKELTIESQKSTKTIVKLLQENEIRSTKDDDSCSICYELVRTAFL